MSRAVAVFPLVTHAPLALKPACGIVSALPDNSSTVPAAPPAGPLAKPSGCRPKCYRRHCLVASHGWAAKEPSSQIDSNPGGFAASGIVTRLGTTGFAARDAGAT